MTYTVQRLTPGGSSVEELPAGAALETEGPWLLVRDPAGTVLRCWPSHVIIDVRPTGGD